MHRTLDTIPATSQNKAKHLSSHHCFAQTREYNTRTNPLPLLHTGEEDPFPLLHTGEREITGSLGTENLTQHLISLQASKTFPTCNTLELQIANKIQTTTSCMGNKVPQQKPLNLSTNKFKQ